LNVTFFPLEQKKIMFLGSCKKRRPQQEQGPSRAMSSSFGGAALLSSWVNDELQLSRIITDFERDFANGYLLGEILFKVGLQTDFVEFKDELKPRSITSNYARLVRN
jgi:hypothetical protein